MRPAAVAALCLAVAGCGGTQQTPPHPPPRSPFVGVVSEDTYDGDATYRRRTFERQAEAGVGLVRQPFRWDLVETSPGRSDFAAIDAYVAAAARARMRILPILFGTPPFRSSAPRAGRRAGGAYPPERPADFARYAEAAARRYGPGGSFWTQHPDVPRIPITAWQIWNEPNLPVFWASGPDPMAYTRLLLPAAEAIRRVDPRAEIVSAGLSQSRHGIPFERFARAMYADGAGQALDTLAVHPYASTASGTLAGVRLARRVLQDLGQRERIRVTEFGWASAGPSSRFTVGERGQATQIAAALSALAANRSRLGIAGVVYYDWRDKPPSAEQSDFFGLHTGLLRADGSAKPALAAFQRAVRALIQTPA